MADGGHGFNIKKESDSFFSLEQNIALNHSNWTPEQQHYEALAIFNTKMFPQQVRSYQSEISGKKEMDVSAVWEVVDGKLFNAEYGAFDKMIKNAQTEAERESLILYQKTMVNAPAGTRLVSLDLHANSDGKQAIRYADLSYKDASGKIHIEKRFDIVREKSSLSLNESWVGLYTFAQEGQGKILLSDKISNVGVLVIAPNEEAAVEEIVRDLGIAREIPTEIEDVEFVPQRFEEAQPAVSESDQIPVSQNKLPVREIDLAFVRELAADDLPLVSQQTQRIINSITDELSTSGSRVFIEAAATLAATRAFIKSKHEKAASIQDKEVKPRNMIKPSVKDHPSKPLEVLVESIKFSKANLINRLWIRKEPTAIVRREKHDNRVPITHEPQPNKSEQPFFAAKRLEFKINRESIMVRKDRQLLREKQTEISLTPETLLRRQVLRIREKVKRVRARTEKPVQPVLKSREKRKVFGFSVTRDKFHERRRKGKIRYRESFRLRRRRLLSDQFRSPEVVNKRFHAVPAGRQVPVHESGRKVGSGREFIKNKDNFLHILIYEGLIKGLLKYGAEPLREQNFHTNTENKKILESEPRPWIILAIIWYLNLQREGGAQNNPINQFTNKPMKKKTKILSDFPRQGIIFSSFS